MERLTKFTTASVLIVAIAAFILAFNDFDPANPALTRMAAAAKKFDPSAVRESEVALVAAASGGDG